MKIALIGATGFVRSDILREALARGHQVTAIVRHPEKLTPHGLLTAVQGDVFNQQELTSLLAGHDAVISSFNAFGSHGVDAYDKQIMGTYSIIHAVKAANVARLLMVGGAGSLEVAPHKTLDDTPEFPQEWKETALAMSEVLAILRQEDELDWTLLSPSALIQPGTRTNKFRLGNNELLRDAEGNSKISTQDYAVAMVDELANAAYSRRRFTVGY